MTPAQLDWCSGTWVRPLEYAGHQPALEPGEAGDLRQRRLRLVRRLRKRRRLQSEGPGMPASRETQRGRYIDCGPQNWDDRDG